MSLVEDLRYIFFSDPLSFATTMILGIELCFMVWGRHYARAWRELRELLRRRRRPPEPRDD